MTAEEWIAQQIEKLEEEKERLLPKTEEFLRAHKRVMKINTILEFLKQWEVTE